MNQSTLAARRIKERLDQKENDYQRTMHKYMNLNAPIPSIIQLEQQRAHSVHSMIEDLSKPSKPKATKSSKKIVLEPRVFDLPPHTCTLMWDGRRNHRNSMNCKRCNMYTDYYQSLRKDRDEKRRQMKLRAAPPKKKTDRQPKLLEPTKVDDHLIPSTWDYEYVRPMSSSARSPVNNDNNYGITESYNNHRDDDASTHSDDDSRFRKQLTKQIASYLRVKRKEGMIEQHSLGVQTSPKSRSKVVAWDQSEMNCY